MHDTNIRRRISRVPLRIRVTRSISALIHHQAAEIVLMNGSHSFDLGKLKKNRQLEL